MVRNLFIGVGAALLVLLWLLQSLITPTMANYQAQLVGDGQTRTVSVAVSYTHLTLPTILLV